MPLIASLTTYRNAIIEANSFISIAFKRNRSGRYILAANERDFITDSAFLKIFISWETFLEDSFIQYMIGEPSILGRTVNRYVSPLNELHASNLLIGTQKYVDWANPEIVRKLSSLYFGPGNPFEIFIGAINQDLTDLKTIRNAAAHLTSTTKPKLEALGARKLARPSTGLTVSTLLYSPPPSSTDTILTVYLALLDIAAEGIANA